MAGLRTIPPAHEQPGFLESGLHKKKAPITDAFFISQTIYCYLLHQHHLLDRGEIARF